MASNEPVYRIDYDEKNKVKAVFIDGEEATDYGDTPPTGQGSVIASEGDPENAKGIEIVDIAGRRCVHYFCRWWCIPQ
jgi:hypothetical protein